MLKNSDSKAAQRMRRLRYRRALGIRVLPIEVSIDVVEVLVEQSYLAPDDVHDADAVAHATTFFLEDMADRVTRNEVMLDRW